MNPAAPANGFPDNASAAVAEDVPATTPAPTTESAATPATKRRHRAAKGGRE
ncbi:hypothetical protein CCO02nite_29500 [Cellulomonas composti]|uniref:Uncharacterized protein n=1 Tax=Cellulomonas composti TaxID=266130 RepID=A0A511JEA4_9CELL|nr:hypothetical protein CCO02nite_29500 [Cellulomonas composti]